LREVGWRQKCRAENRMVGDTYSDKRVWKT
jgi:hypothetical protein